MEKNGVIYKIENKSNGNIYIGQTIRPLEVRVRKHIQEKSLVGKAIIKYGIDNFNIDVIEHCDSKEKLNQREIFWIAYFNCKAPNGYNLTDGGGGCYGYHPSDEIRAKISTKNKGKKRSPESCIRIGLSSKGRHHTSESKAKISAAQKNKIISEETKSKISRTLKGHPVSQETRAKMSAAKKGKKLSPETKEKLSKLWKGRHHTKESKAKMSEIAKKRWQTKRNQLSK